MCAHVWYFLDERNFKTMFHFPDSDTGYYEDEYSFFAHDRELELIELEREQRFEAQAEEMHERLWAGPVDMDPETGCTAAEMKEEEEIDIVNARPIGCDSHED